MERGGGRTPIGGSSPFPQDVLEKLFEEDVDAVFVLDKNLRVQAANRRAGEMLGVRASSLRRTHLSDHVAPHHRDEFLAFLTQARSGGSRGEYDLTRDGEERIPAAWTAFGIETPTQDLVVARAQDVSDVVVERRASDVLLAAAQAGEDSRGARELAQDILDSVEPHLRHELLALFGASEHADGLVLLAARGGHPRFHDDFASVPVTRPPATPLAEAAYRRTTVVVEDATIEDFGKPWQRLVEETDVRAVALVPLMHHGRFMGLLLAGAHSSGALEHRDLEVLELFSHEIATRLNAQSMRDALAGMSARQDRVVDAYRRSNEDLEAFTYTVGHDLSAPMRSIEVFATYLLKDHGDSIPSEAREYAERIRKDVRRAKRMLDGIAHLARIGRNDASFERVDSGEVVREAMDAVESRARESNVRIHVEGEFPEVWAQRVRLEEVFANLVSNALKFNDKDEGNIWIRAGEEPHAHVFTVEDDGPGIPPDYRDQVFGLFQRLPSTAEVEGTGAGLAIVRKIVESHGGTIAVRERPGGGASFSFKLPKAREVAGTHSIDPTE